MANQLENKVKDSLEKKKGFRGSNKKNKRLGSVRGGKSR
jgi:hypothetical protein